MANRPAKIIQIESKRRHVRGRLTSTGEFLRLIGGGRARRTDDDGPRAA